VTDLSMSASASASASAAAAAASAGLSSGPEAVLAAGSRGMLPSDLADEDTTTKKLGLFFWICVAWILLVIVMALIANLLPLPNPTIGNYNAPQNAGPGWGHLLGTDDLYRDIFSRLVFGSRVSLIVGFGGTLIGLMLGGVPAMISAYRRGRVDTLLNTTSYVVLAFPAIVAVIAIVSFWGHALWKITLVIGIAGAPLIFRVIRASTLSYATRDFVLAAKALGASDRRILAREILPNILPTVVSFGLIAVASIIVLEGSLAFLGLSVQPPTPSWGNMLNESASLLTGGKGQTNPWLVIFPAGAMFLLLFSLNVVADKLRSYFDVTEVKL
jgi:peptide/nickel transport system permease protein